MELAWACACSLEESLVLSFFFHGNRSILLNKFEAIVFSILIRMKVVYPTEFIQLPPSDVVRGEARNWQHQIQPMRRPQSSWLSITNQLDVVFSPKLTFPASNARAKKKKGFRGMWKSNGAIGRFRRQPIGSCLQKFAVVLSARAPNFFCRAGRIINTVLGWLIADFYGDFQPNGWDSAQVYGTTRWMKLLRNHWKLLSMQRYGLRTNFSSFRRFKTLLHCIFCVATGSGLVGSMMSDSYSEERSESDLSLQILVIEDMQYQ